MINLVDIAFISIVSLGGTDRYLPSEIEDYSERIAAICESDSHMLPVNEDCVKVASVLWKLETNLSPYTKRDRYGCGPVQVLQPRSRSKKPGFKNTRIGNLFTAPPCETLKIFEVGINWGVTIFRWKQYKSRTLKQAFRWYNESSNKNRYAKKAIQYWKRITKANEQRNLNITAEFELPTSGCGELAAGVHSDLL